MRKVMALLASSLIFLAGCAVSSKNSTTPSSGGTAAPAQKVKIAAVTKTLGTEYWANIAKGIQDAGKAVGADVTVQAPEKPTDIDAQIRFVEDVIQKKEAKYLILAPIDAKALVPAVEKAKAAGIETIIISDRLDSTVPVTFVGVDQKVLAVSLTEYLAKFTKEKLGGKANVVILEGTPGAGTTIDRHDGFNQVLKANPGMAVIGSQTAKYTRSDAVKVMEDMLTRFPKIDIVLAANDEMALGALQAIEARKLKVGQDIFIAGINAQKESVQAVRDKKMLVTLYANEYGMGYKAVEVAFAMATKGEKPAKEIIGKTGLVVDSSNVEGLKLEREFK